MPQLIASRNIKVLATCACARHLQILRNGAAPFMRQLALQKKHLNMFKAKVQEIFDAVKLIHRDAIIRLVCRRPSNVHAHEHVLTCQCPPRLSNPHNPVVLSTQAFVGYRDYGDAEQYVVKQFVPHSQSDQLIRVLNAVDPSGGGDAAEDVAGGMQASSVAPIGARTGFAPQRGLTHVSSGVQKALELEWTAETRLVVHFADAPAHGRAYPDLPSGTEMDRWPDGGPECAGVPQHFTSQTRTPAECVGLAT